MAGKAKQKKQVCACYMSISPSPRPTIIMPANKEFITYQAFAFTTGKVPTDTIVLNEDGSVDI